MTDLDPMTLLDEDFIDRIVDGGLTPRELRAAIDRLDRQPDGWKRCALAFLEAQGWREAFRALDEPAGGDRAMASPLRPPAAGRPARSSGRWRRGIMAAGVAAASFAMGWLVHSARPSSPTDDAITPTAQAIATGHDAPEPPPGTPGAVDPSRPTDVLARDRSDNRSPPHPSADVVAVARLRLGTEGDGLEVPILAGPGIDEEWLLDQPPPVSEHGQALWQRRGYQIDQRRRLLTATLADGRRVTVPVDQVQICYTGNDPL